MNITYKKNIWAFFDITRHNELKDKYFEATGLDAHAYVIESSFKRFFVFKHKWHKFKKGTDIMQGLKSKNKKIWRKRGKHAKKKRQNQDDLLQLWQERWFCSWMHRPKKGIVSFYLKLWNSCFQYYYMNWISSYVDCIISTSNFEDFHTWLTNSLLSMV